MSCVKVELSKNIKKGVCLFVLIIKSKHEKLGNYYGWVQLTICRTQISNAVKNIYFPMTQVTFLEFPH